MSKLIFLGCLSISKYQETCKNAIKLIKKLDNNYKFIENAPCCGALSFHVANQEELRTHIEFVYNWLKQNEITELITICTACYKYFSTYYTQYIPNFNIKISHILQFLAKPESLEKLNLKYKGKKLKITYHDPCHLQTAEPKILNEPRKIIKNIKGDLDFRELKENENISLCCGSGGGAYSIFKENSDISSRYIFKRAKRAQYILISCPFCYTALSRIKDEDKKKRIDVIKFEDFIYKLMNGEEI